MDHQLGPVLAIAVRSIVPENGAKFSQTSDDSLASDYAGTLRHHDRKACNLSSYYGMDASIELAVITV